MRVAAVILLAMFAIAGVMLLSQEQLLFPTGAVPDAGQLPPGAERLEIETPDGDMLHGVHLPPAAGGRKPTTLILGFGGNAWNGQHVAEYLHEQFPEADVVAFHYRGYRPSTGRPSAGALMADAPLVFDTAVEHVGPERVVAIGFSIGSGVAARLSRKRTLDGLVLVTPFDSLKAVAQQLYPWLPVGPFFQHELPTADDLAGGDTAVAIIAAERDEIIPPKRTDALRKRVPHLVFDRTIAGAGHNDIYSRGDFQESMREAFNAVAAK